MGSNFGHGHFCILSTLVQKIAKVHSPKVSENYTGAIAQKSDTAECK